jgi:DNA-binding IclR family transcriptional regulator
LVGALLATPNQTVSELVRNLNLSVSGASQYLRALNARGLLRAERKGRHVYYRVAPDPRLPEAEMLVSGLEQAFAAEVDPVEALFHQVTAFTHPRRIAIVALLQGAPLSLPELQRQSGIPFRALHRHLVKLLQRGVVVNDGNTLALTAPPTLMADMLLRIATESGE